jgi:hypothetical protein
MARESVKIILVLAPGSMIADSTSTLTDAVPGNAVVPVVTVNAEGAAVVELIAVFIVTVKMRPVASKALDVYPGAAALAA